MLSTALNPVLQVPPPAELPTAKLMANGILYLHHDIMQALNLRAGQPINLLPPVYGSALWLLDLRPIAPRVVLHTPNQRPRVKGIRLPPGLVTAPLTLQLLPGEPHYPHVYCLLPAHALPAQP